MMLMLIFVFSHTRQPKCRGLRASNNRIQDSTERRQIAIPVPPLTTGTQVVTATV